MNLLLRARAPCQVSCPKSNEMNVEFFLRCFKIKGFQYEVVAGLAKSLVQTAICMELKKFVKVLKKRARKRARLNVGCARRDRFRSN